MFAAIAHRAETESWGYSHGHHELSDARAAALNEAGNGASIVGWVEDGYVALAVSSGGSYGSGYGRAKSDAERRAVEECELNGGDDPEIVCWVHSG